MNQIDLQLIVYATFWFFSRKNGPNSRLLSMNYWARFVFVSPGTELSFQ